jgi:uncharacterized membrane protein
MIGEEINGKIERFNKKYMELLELIIAQTVKIVDFSFVLMGILFVVWGGLEAAIRVAIDEVKKHRDGEVQEIENNNRGAFASKLILGLEFFIAVDIINTVQNATWDSLGKLAFLVAIRAVLSFVLNMEIESIKKHLAKVGVRK